MSSSAIIFINALVERFPGLKRVLEQHTKGNFGETLPNLFFGDFTRYVLSLFDQMKVGDREFPAAQLELRRILAYLDDEFDRGDDEIKDLIAVSFIECLPRPDEQGSDIRKLLGPNMRAQLRRIEYRVVPLCEDPK